MFRRCLRIALALSTVCAVVLIGCSDSPTVVEEGDLSFLDDAPIFPYELVEIPDEELWDTGYGVLDTTAYDQDEEGVRMSEYKGELYYAPVQTANWGLALLDNYRTTGEAAYRRLAIKHADRMIQEAVEMDGAYYYPYWFDFQLHGLTNPADLLPAPWYSGMGQGRVLQLLTRVYKETGDEKYLDACRKTFTSFLRPRGIQDPFTVEVDHLGFYWIEEYPRSVPTQVLNGFIYGLYGLYEYYMLTKDETVLRVTQASLTTLREYASDFRNPGGISYYCLAHRATIATYHRWHIRLINDLYRMTWDTFFKYLAEALQKDYS